MPPGDTATLVLDQHRPDLLLMTPLLYFGSQQVEYVRAAKAAGIPCVLGVGSWDHLTTKGRIHERPHRVVVWNEFQRAEAAELFSRPEPLPLKRCIGRNCGWFFLDTSRNKSRHWCSMTDCGNRAKARRHRARRQEERAG